MIEDSDDRWGGSSYIVHGRELGEWEKLCMRFRLQDTWSSQTFVRVPLSLSYSRSDRRVMGTNLSRIDRIYVTDMWQNVGGTIQIMSGTIFSDHAPMIMHIVKERIGSSQNAKIPEAIILDDLYHKDVVRIWQHEMQSPVNIVTWVAKAVQVVSSLFKNTTRLRYKAYRDKEIALKRVVSSLQRIQEKRPHCL